MTRHEANHCESSTSNNTSAAPLFDISARASCFALTYTSMCLHVTAVYDRQDVGNVDCAGAHNRRVHPRLGLHASLYLLNPFSREHKKGLISQPFFVIYQSS
jgi:hypothetical protein